MLPMQNSRGIEPTDLDLSPSPRAEYRVIKMEEDVRSALLSRYYKESKLGCHSMYLLIVLQSYSLPNSLVPSFSQTFNVFVASTQFDMYVTVLA